ncbi:hypothetical protein LJ737_21575 [Hymenobacter sp. 15J16-1T3B]|uniref:hypothetical protein n=1 Tax=Hymenobacter sp. 15J16-1T3B TaxID=2886941 RepID=UPI001D1252F5|nr:hypothetical protein [Hymenobacter sp. 15J16-1T3B]MCC3159847.1 hypothetical protein [Hymenobacter sp. 15J16-1T3B]
MTSVFPLIATCWLALRAAALPAESEAYRRHVLADAALLPAERLPQYAGRSFAPVWLHADDAGALGFIGPNYQRLDLKLLSVQPTAGQPGQYTVTGKSRVKTNVAAFQGTFRVLHVRVNRDRPRTVDDEPTVAVKSGIVLAAYELREPAGQPGTGIFRGVLQAKWYEDARGRLYYDNLLNVADSYANNQGVGTWTSYRSGQVKRCNWGDYRIPNSGDLDQGAAEFSPSAKYLAYGWQQYRQAWTEQDPAAKKRELAAWWR